MSTNSILFHSLRRPPAQSRWQSFAISYSAQGAALLAIVYLTIVAPVISPPVSTHIELVAPDLRPMVKAAPRPPLHKPEIAVVEQPKVVLPEPPKVQPVIKYQTPQRVQKVLPVAEVKQPEAPKFESKVLNALPGPKVAPKIVATNTFGGSSATPTLQNISPTKVQTGGFGDPNGVPVNKNGSNRPTIAAAGSFDLPPGGGYGNGYGGTHGVRGTVASAGFGNGVAVTGGGGKGGNAAQGRVQSTSFALRVEGDVILSVIFSATGQVKVLGVVNGLGHGLDEAAVQAVQGIRFTPAMRDGHPVDLTTNLRIRFQLS